jgi:hypothetical protein
MSTRSSRRITAITIAEIVGLAAIVFAVLAMFYWIGVAAADTGSGSSAPIPDPDSNPGDFLEQSFAALRSGNWTIVAAFALIGVTWVARKPWALGRIKFLSTDRGGVVLALSVSLIGGFAHALAATGKLPDLTTLKAILTTAVAGMGGYTALKRLVWPPTPAP